MLVHVSRDFCPERFGLLCESEVICFLDSLYFRYDGVQYTAVIRRRCAWACAACLLYGRCGGWRGFGRLLALVVTVVPWFSAGWHCSGGSCWLRGRGLGRCGLCGLCVLWLVVGAVGPER